MYNLYFYIVMYSIGGSAAVHLSRLGVPPVADLQDDVTLDCAYDMGEEQLYSVKWYKDEEEFFRYVPSGGGTLWFPVQGVHAGAAGPRCDAHHCSVTLTRLSRLAAGSYRCEVSTEAPAFRVAFDTANMSVVALPRGAVTIAWPRAHYTEDEEIRVNCTSPPAAPPPAVRWLVNGAELGAEGIVAQTDSQPDALGLVRRSLAARLNAARRLFPQRGGLLELRCEVRPPPPAPQRPLHAAVYAQLSEPHPQRFDWASSTAARPALAALLIALYPLVRQ